MPPTEEAGLLTDLNIPQPRVVAAYGLCGPAQAKRINYERRQMHTYCNKRPLGPRGNLLPCGRKETLKYHGYNYGVYWEKMFQENGIIPHIDLSAAAVQLFLNIPILVVKTSFTHNPTTNKKEWFCGTRSPWP